MLPNARVQKIEAIQKRALDFMLKKMIKKILTKIHWKGRGNQLQIKEEPVHHS